ncbi:aminodeoxychorismate lyase [Paenibacillus sediminis]|uniref:4-amino-4-deoxychorismate lyase n=1 Tax=Paenibacillus sediminis TaxID=664909 RepID=A0ABS4H7F6_9BACL|nr:aminodeoxychorismate lyase [Paenibacillus sediminis]MBP1938468.1 4-amino-4-deoxychorismate lyase [Paenibacillus sediminis]
MNYIGMNGAVIPASEAVISVMDHGFLYGMGLFETFRTYHGVPFLLDEHLERLEAGCKELGIEHHISSSQINDEIKSLLAANNLRDAYIRYTVSAGVDVLGLPSANYHRATRVMYMKELPSFSPSVYEWGKSLLRLKLRRNTPEGKVRLKSLHYMNNILAKRELLESLQAASAQAEGLFLTEKGYLAEGIVSNLFFVKQDRLYTPAIENGILPGITRAFVIQLARELGIKIAEGNYTWDHLVHADEAFITSSIQEVVPITSLIDTDGAIYKVNSGTVGPVTSQLLNLYRKKAGMLK